FRCQSVALDTRSPGNLGIRDVANEQVSEDVFGLSGDRCSSFATYELSALEPVEPLFDLASLETGDVRERARPEHPAHDGGILKERLLLRDESVDARRKDPLDRLGQGRRLAFLQPTLLEERDELLRVERVASRALQER